MAKSGQLAQAHLISTTPGISAENVAYFGVAVDAVNKARVYNTQNMGR